MHEDGFEEIKNRLLRTLVLHLPYSKSRFQLFSDTSKTAAGSALYQIQNRTFKFVKCVSKRLHQQQQII